MGMLPGVIVFPTMSMSASVIARTGNIALANRRGNNHQHAYESLVDDIVDATNEQNKSKLRRALVVAGRTLKWTETDLHQLYQKRLDPKVRNFTALVWWSVKVRDKTETNSLGSKS